MKHISDVLQPDLKELQPEINFPEVIETMEKPPSHFQLKFPGETVTKDNNFTFYRIFMHSNEAQRRKGSLAYDIFISLVSACHSRKDTELKPCQVKVKDVLAYNNTDLGGTDYKRIKQALYALKSMLVEVDTPNRIYVDSIISGPAIYYKKTGIVEAQINPALAPFFLKLYENYSVYGLNEFLNLKSIYAKRLFEIACAIYPKSSQVFELPKLQHMLDIKPESSKYYDFKRWILEPAKKDINQTTNLKFNYEAIKTGRAVTHIKIIVKRMKTYDILED